MKKNFITFILALLLIGSSNRVFAHHCCDVPEKLTPQKEARLDNYLDSRLHFSDEQKVLIKQNRKKFRKQIEKEVVQMKKIHDEIRNVYLTGIPKYQADIKTAPKKAQLVLLKNNVDRIRAERRKNFEQILDENQKVEFEKIKKESQMKK